MSTQSNGTTFNVSNMPGKNGAPDNAWENVGNLFLDSNGRFGTLYLNPDVATLESWLAAAKASKEGKLSKKVTVVRRQPKSSGGSQPSSDAASKTSSSRRKAKAANATSPTAA